MKISILILTLFIYFTNGYRINDDNNDDEWARIPQIDGTFRLISVKEAKSLYLEETSEKISYPIGFLLYTRSNPDNGEIIDYNDAKALKKSNFNKKLPTRFIIHGWRNNFNSSVNNYIRKAYLEYEKFNIFVVDWSSIADTINYYTARYSVEEIGERIAKYIDFVHKSGGLSFKTLKLIGHSLGAHCAGYAGKYIQRGTIHTIIGLDPAWPLFSYNKPLERLSSSDALYVETIHTSGGSLGFLDPIGKASFYPNWGQKQPGCGLDLTKQCAHERSYKLFSESIKMNNFLPKKCENYDELLKQKCEINVKKIKMGHPNNYMNANGIYFVATNSEEPFGNGLAKE